MHRDWIAVLDPGTSQMRAGLYRLASNGRIGELFLAQSSSEGIRRGVVDDPSALGRSIRGALSQLAEQSRIEVRAVQVAWRVRQVEEGAHVPRRRAYRGVLPQELVDSTGTLAQFADQGLERALAEAGVSVSRWFCIGDVAARGTATSSELERRVMCLDIGSGVTDWALLEAGRWVDSGSIPIGGDHFTSDLAAFTRMPLGDAERFKHSLAALASGQGESAWGEQVFSLSDLRLVLEARSSDLCDAVGTILRERFAVDLVLLTGGASQLVWLTEILSGELRVPVRRGLPRGVGSPQAFPADPGWCPVAGMVRNGLHEARASRNSDDSILDWLGSVWASWWHRE